VNSPSDVSSACGGRYTEGPTTGHNAGPHNAGYQGSATWVSNGQNCNVGYNAANSEAEEDERLASGGDIHKLNLWVGLYTAVLPVGQNARNHLDT
jgi:hypothetical protein